MGISFDTARDLVDAIDAGSTRKYVLHDATVVQADGGGIFVAIDDGAPLTPIASTAARVKLGDRAQVSIQDGRAMIVGNLTTPATDDTRADEAHEVASKAQNVLDVLSRAVSVDDAGNVVVSGLAVKIQPSSAESYVILEQDGVLYLDGAGIKVGGRAPVKVGRCNLTPQTNVPANGLTTWTEQLYQAGYKALAVAGWFVYNANTFNLERCFIDQDGNLQLALHNSKSTAQSMTGNSYVDVLYVREELA